MLPFFFAAISGALLTLSFPRVGHPAFAWVALVPLLVAVYRAPRWQAGWLGLLAGVVHFAGTIYWIPNVMVDYGGLPLVAAWLVHALFVLVLATFPAVFAFAMSDVVSRFGSGGLLLAPAIWVTSELGRTYVFTGFPWMLLGYSQVPFLAVAQAASVVGVLGVSALVASVNATVAYVVTAETRARRTPVVATVVLVAGVLAFGEWRLQRSELAEAGTALRVAALQGNVVQDDKWDPGKSDAILSTYVRQTETAAQAGADLIVWPEAATPFPLARDPRGEIIRSLARQTRTHLLIGTTEIETDDQTRYYNAAYMIDPAGDTTGIYRKQHLVPFGEYVPLRRALFFVSPLVEAVAGFSAGTEPRALPFGDRLVSTAICYEIIYPGLVRELTLAGADLLTTLTNDAWYGRTAAPYQHFQMARMRAIEQGRYLVRAANTGISGVIDPYGQVLARSPLFEQAVVVEEVRLLAQVTPYGRFGDAPAYAGVAITLVALGSRRRPRSSAERRRNGDDNA